MRSLRRVRGCRSSSHLRRPFARKSSRNNACSEDMLPMPLACHQSNACCRAQDQTGTEPTLSFAELARAVTCQLSRGIHGRKLRFVFAPRGKGSRNASATHHCFALGSEGPNKKDAVNRSGLPVVSSWSWVRSSLILDVLPPVSRIEEDSYVGQEKHPSVASCRATKIDQTNDAVNLPALVRQNCGPKQFSPHLKSGCDPYTFSIAADPKGRT